MDETIIEIIISEAQNEVEDFQKWGLDIIPHRARMKKGFRCSTAESAWRWSKRSRNRSIRSGGDRLRDVADRV